MPPANHPRIGPLLAVPLWVRIETAGQTARSGSLGLTSFSSYSSSPSARRPGPPPRCHTLPQRRPKFPKCEPDSRWTCGSSKGGQQGRGRAGARPRFPLFAPSLLDSLAHPLSGSPGLCRLNGGRSPARVSELASCTPRSLHGPWQQVNYPPGADGDRSSFPGRAPALSPLGPAPKPPPRPAAPTRPHTTRRLAPLPAQLCPAPQLRLSSPLTAHPPPEIYE